MSPMAPPDPDRPSCVIPKVEGNHSRSATPVTLVQNEGRMSHIDSPQNTRRLYRPPTLSIDDTKGHHPVAP